jgi:hypothetical protein
MMFDYDACNDEMRATIVALEGLGYQHTDTRIDSEGIAEWYIFEASDSNIIVAICDSWYRAWDKTQALPVSYHFTLVSGYWKQSGWSGQVSKTDVPADEELLASVLADYPHYGHCGLPAKA